jgi:hypothetical protein
VNVAAEAVQLCDSHRAPLTSCFVQGCRKLRTALKGVGALARLYLDEDAAQREAFGFCKALLLKRSVR